MAFGLRLISISPQIQSALRIECLGYGDSLPYDQIDTLPYLDAVVKEMLRCFPSIPGTVREDSTLARHKLTSRSAKLPKTTSYLSSDPSRLSLAKPSHPSESVKARSFTYLSRTSTWPNLSGDPTRASSSLNDG